ncbi:polysaccharide deacetylase family protein [Collinsella sp. zg1085]|uniref:polysaccharide deacetylase family protein n=1 Tax=Collinsella sp. zg1085 TaxID=2844380 RepID=UPI001C0BE62D|nr:polysaccharide deacetylase family protein [Collinsella sp. zg1085]QWT17787.1 polysaccharide deacetylase family protein [Collinsella sp. zg1085]
MSPYTTSYTNKRRPRLRPARTRSLELPATKRRHQRKPGERYITRGLTKKRSTHRGFRRNERKPYAIIAVLCAFLIFVASVVWYANRGVTITLNGNDTTVRLHSTIERIVEDKKLKLKPGRLLAVDDAVLSKGGGEPYHVTLNKKELTVQEAAKLELNGGEELEIQQGHDTYEPHQVQATELKPSISMEGKGAIQYVATWGVSGRHEVWIGETSGKTQDRGVVQEPVHAVIKATSVNPKKGKKLIALTFDEGPSIGTADIVRILADKGAKGTFFLQGSAVGSNLSAVQSILSGNNQLGSNAQDDVDLTKLGYDDLRAQLSQGFAAIQKAGGGTVSLLRPPSGLYTVETWAQSMDLVQAVVTWNLDSGDWMLKGADTVVSTVVEASSNGNIVLLTDNVATTQQTAAALPHIIDQLKAAGYELVTLSELIESDEDLSRELKLGQAHMPDGASLPEVTKASESTSAVE